MRGTTEKRTILYIGDEYGRDSYLREELEKNYNLVTYSNLDSGVIDVIRRFHNGEIHAMITNMPPNAVRYSPALLAIRTVFIQDCYHDSLNVLKKIKKITDIPIIIYTGAGNTAAVEIVFLGMGDEIVHKSGDREKDSQEIHDALDRLLEKYEKIASSLQI